MKKKSFLLFLLLFVLLFSAVASADMGPKPSVRITFSGRGEEACYGTLLSKEEYSGPAQVWDGTEENARHDQNPQCLIANPMPYDLWKAFVAYQDADGFYFLQQYWDVGAKGTLNWTYYPPETFKILLYYPQSNTFAVSGIYEREDFHSCFSVDLSGMEIASVRYEQEKSAIASKPDVEFWEEFDKQLADRSEKEEGTESIFKIEADTVKKTPDPLGESVSFLFRLVATLLIELGLALLFGYRHKKQLWLIGGVNVATQILLNLGLYLGYQQVDALFYLYLFMELLVLAIEAVIYGFCFHRWSTGEDRFGRSLVYALSANALSFGIGLLIAQWLPQLF